MRLIDADALPRYTGYALSADEVAEAVENAPTIDAVPVVRCKDCKYWDSVSWYCPDVARRSYPDGYCHWGERKDDDKR